MDIHIYISIDHTGSTHILRAHPQGIYIYCNRAHIGINTYFQSTPTYDDSYFISTYLRVKGYGTGLFPQEEPSVFMTHTNIPHIKAHPPEVGLVFFVIFFSSKPVVSGGRAARPRSRRAPLAVSWSCTELKEGRNFFQKNKPPQLVAKNNFSLTGVSLFWWKLHTAGFRSFFY